MKKPYDNKMLEVKDEAGTVIVQIFIFDDNAKFTENPADFANYKSKRKGRRTKEEIEWEKINKLMRGEK